MALKKKKKNKSKKPTPKAYKQNAMFGSLNHKFSDLTVKKLEEAFALDCSINEACFYADITKQTFFNWKKRNPKLFDRFEQLREQPVLEARKKVVASVKIDADIAFRYLERKRKDEFGAKTFFHGEVFNGEIDPKHREIARKLINKMKPQDIEQENEE